MSVCECLWIVVVLVSTAPWVLKQTFTQQAINTENTQVWWFTTKIMTLIRLTHNCKEQEQTLPSESGWTFTVAGKKSQTPFTIITRL